MKKFPFTGFLRMALCLLLVLGNSGLASAATAVTLSKLVLNTNELTLAVGDTSSLTATAVYSDGTTANVTASADWSSNASSVATVYNGTITAKAEGTATIVGVYTYTDGTKLSQAVTVNVTKKVKALTQSVYTLDLKKGGSDTITLTATYTDNTTDSTVSSDADWSTSDASVATVVNGKVTGIGAGTAVITGEYGSKTISVTVDVDVAKRITPDQSQVSLLLNEDKSIVLTATYPDGTTADVTSEAQWSSSDESVADVLKGVITGYKQGTATITASYGTKTAAVEVDVDQTSKLTVSDTDVFLRLEGTRQLTLTAGYPDGTSKDVTSAATWYSSDSEVAYVYKGKIYGYSAGTATIYGTYGDKSVAVDVDVSVARFLDLSESQISLGLKSSSKVTLTATYADGTTEDVTNQAAWSSSNTAVAYVKQGIITGAGTGTAVITASYGTNTAELEAEVGSVSKLNASETGIFLKASGTEQISLTAVASDGSSSDVTSLATWSSSDKSVATVSKGLVTGIAMGSATITAAYKNLTATVAVDVATAKHLALSKTSLNLAVNGSETVKLTATLADGTTADVTADAVWSSSDENVAYVSKGAITGYTEGEATITASYGSSTAAVSVAVGKSSRLSVDDSTVNLRLNGIQQLKLTSMSSEGTSADVTESAVWTSSDSDVAYVSKGLITGYKSGTATVTASYGGKSVTVSVSVEQASRLAASPGKLNLGINQSQTVTVMANYADGTSEDVTADAAWSSSDESVAGVDDGKITVYETGSATITATYAGKTATIKVTAGTPSKLSFSEKSVDLKEEATYSPVLTAEYENGGDVTVTTEAEWSTSDDTIAQVDDDGTITGTGVGTATITAKYGSVKATITVNVGLTDELEADVSLIAISVSETSQITVTATDSDGTEADVTAKAEWTSSKPTVATVKKGLVTAVLKGKTTVTASYGGQKVTVNVEVDQVSQIEASVDGLEMKSGDSQKVTVTVTFSNGDTRDVTSKAEWKTGSYKIATATAGTIKAAAYGKTTITAKYAGKTVRIPVTVDLLKYLDVNQTNVTLNKGETLQLTATATYLDESEADVTKAAVWSSSKDSVVTAKNGLIKANGKGSATITVKYGNKSVKIKVVIS